VKNDRRKNEKAKCSQLNALFLGHGPFSPVRRTPAAWQIPSSEQSTGTKKALAEWVVFRLPDEKNRRFSRAGIFETSVPEWNGARGRI
jgi:hypothetical protein